MRIRSYLAWMVAAALVPVVIAAAVAVGKVRQAERTAALAGLNETVRATSLVVDRETQGSLSALKALGDSAHLQSGDMQAFYAQALALNQPPHVWTLLLDDKATLVLNTALPFGTPLPPASAWQQVRLQRMQVPRWQRQTPVFEAAAVGALALAKAFGPSP